MNLKTKYSIIKAFITKRSPVYVQFALSKRCNLRCMMCQAVESRKYDNELNIDEIKKLADVLNILKVGIIVLTGGEPLLRNDLVDIVSIFTQKGFDVRIQTNGQLVDEDKIKALLDAGLKEVTLSLDSLDPNKQDMINKKSGSWDRTIKALTLFSKLLPKKGNITGVNTVVSKLNITETPKLVKFITSLGFYSSLIPVHLYSSDDDSDFIVRTEVTSDFGFTEKDNLMIDEVYGKLIQMKKDGYHIHNSIRFLEESPKYLKYNKVDWRCDSPDLYFSISPQGVFQPCVDLMGTKSMLDSDFLEVYHSPSFRTQIRDIVKNCPGCFYACYPEITFFYRDIKTLLERTIQSYKVSRFKRIPFSYDKVTSLAEEISREE